MALTINTLEAVKNKNERQPFDYLPLCTRSGNDLRTHFVRLGESWKVGLLNEYKRAPIRQWFLFPQKNRTLKALPSFFDSAAINLHKQA